MLQLFKESNQHYIKHRMEGQTNRSLNSFSLICSELPIKQEISNTIELTSCLVHVLCDFSTECLMTSREFSLLFEKAMKTCCCFIVSFKWKTSLCVSITFRCIYFSLYTVKIDRKTNSSTLIETSRVETSNIYYSLCHAYICYYVLFNLTLGRIWNFFHKLNFQFQLIL